MEPFKFDSSSGSPFQGGVVINGYTSFRWTERYRGISEFEFEAPLSKGLVQLLPLGTFISHVDTKEVMIVEDHQIKEDKDKDPVVKITGRGLDSAFEQRIVGANQAWANAVPPTEYILVAAASLGVQIKKLIDDHVVVGGSLADANNELPYLAVFNTVPAVAAAERVVKRQTLSKAVEDLLDVGDFGLKIDRQDTGIVNMTIHAGVDKSSTVTFAWIVGELDSAQYLWSSRKRKNTALVRGRYVEQFVYGAEAKWDRRIVLVDGSDLDDYLDTAPSGATLTAIRTKMSTRGAEVLRMQHDINMAQVEVSAFNQFRYRADYNIGDVVSVAGNYGAVVLRRVTEYTEIEDENGEIGQPTLSNLT